VYITCLGMHVIHNYSLLSQWWRVPHDLQSCTLHLLDKTTVLSPIVKGVPLNPSSNEPKPANTA